jgi:hypothetical protein
MSGTSPVVCAHIIDNNDGSKQDFTPPNHADHSDKYPNPHRDFELILYHTSQRVNNKGDVFVINYDSTHPELISHQYNSPCSGSIIEYADAMRLKLKLAGIHDSTDLMTIFEGRTHAESSAVFKMHDIDQQVLKTSTVQLLEEETLRHLAHAKYNFIRYNQMITEIGPDNEPEIFPKANILLHHVVSAVSINQRRHKPNWWVNRVTLLS